MKAIITTLFLFVSTFTTFAQDPFSIALADSAFTLTKDHVRYDATYFNIAYPGGDVPANRGVCTDVVIRAYRKMGIDLQKEVHEDMKKNFTLYPKIWGLKTTDKNIDHRRVPNLMAFFSRFGQSKPITKTPADYLPGDIICWRIRGGMTHIGIVSKLKSPSTGNYYIIHNVGVGQVLEDFLFQFPIIGHYQYNPKITP